MNILKSKQILLFSHGTVSKAGLFQAGGISLVSSARRQLHLWTGYDDGTGSSSHQSKEPIPAEFPDGEIFVVYVLAVQDVDQVS